jgi:transposase-like protein
MLGHCAKSQQPMISAAIRGIFSAASGHEARERLAEVVERLEPIAPKVARLVLDAEADLLGFYALPREHWSKLKRTNPLERVNREIGRRTDVVGIFPDDAALIRLAGSLLVEQNDCHEGRAGRRGGPSSPRRRLGACQSDRFDARRSTCSISASTGAPAARPGAPSARAVS